LLHVPVPAVFRGRRQRVVGATATWLQTHILHAGGRPLHVQVPQLGLEVVDVPAAIFDLSIETGKYGRVVGGLAHGIGGIDEGPLAVDFALHIGNGFVDVRHGEDRMCWIGAKRASGDFFTDRGDGVTNVPSEGRLPGIDSARVDTRHVSYLRARETAVPTRPGRRRREGRVCDGGRRQWRSRRRAVVMSLGEQRFSSRIGWLSGAPLHFPPLRRVASGKGKVPLSIKSRGCCLASSGARLRQET
jgi:hypothetical protein